MADRRMAALRIIEALDEFEDRSSRLGLCLEPTVSVVLVGPMLPYIAAQAVLTKPLLVETRQKAAFGRKAGSRG
jgi:hypothetical protein